MPCFLNPDWYSRDLYVRKRHSAVSILEVSASLLAPRLTVWPDYALATHRPETLDTMSRAFGVGTPLPANSTISTPWLSNHLRPG